MFISTFYVSVSQQHYRQASYHLWTCQEQGTSVADSTDNGSDWHDQLNSYGYVDTDRSSDQTDSAGKTPAYIKHRVMHCVDCTQWTDME